FQDKAIVSDRVIRQKRTSAADVADQLISGLFRLVIFLCADLVHSAITQGHKHFVALWRVGLLDLFKRHEGQIEETIVPAVLLIDGESRDLVIAVSRKVIVREPGDVAGAKNDQFRHEGRLLLPDQNRKLVERIIVYQRNEP